LANGPDERRIRVRSIRVDGPRFAAHQPTAHPAQWSDAKRRAIKLFYGFCISPKSTGS